jgi:beta-aspartyl-peptidase (threonine type)
MKTRGKTAGKERAVLVVHGGAGVIKRESMTPEMEKQYRQALERSLKAGFNKLKQGHSALDAVEAAVKALEDSPLFNAGRGAVFTENGRIELDAAIMEGSSHAAGAVSCVNCAKNPISAARAVMERSPHVLLMGEGANTFVRNIAPEAKLKIVDEEYFRTQYRWDNLQEYLRKAKSTKTVNLGTKRKYGTVGAVAIDDKGNLACATSTGGTTGKKFGRTGDSPIIGAGTYADSSTCAVSCTGHGEFFMRNVSAYDCSALMKYKKLTVEAAANEVIHNALTASGGEGGLIAIDAKGNFAMPFNSKGMFRGYVTAEGATHVAIFED